MNLATPAPDYRMPHGVVDTSRGTWAMGLFILTEAMLFLMLFFTYYYLGHQARSWPPEPPTLALPLVMLAVLASSSAVLHLGERAARVQAFGRARAMVGVTAVMGLGFLALQAMEYRDHLTRLRPTTDAYGSIFYTLTGVHAAHVVLGLLMLGYVLLLPAPHLGAASKPPHHCLRNAALYWHFVDVVWVVIVVLMYIAPNVGL